MEEIESQKFKNDSQEIISQVLSTVEWILSGNIFS